MQVFARMYVMHAMYNLHIFQLGQRATVKHIRICVHVCMFSLTYMCIIAWCCVRMHVCCAFLCVWGFMSVHISTYALMDACDRAQVRLQYCAVLVMMVCIPVCLYMCL